MRRLQMLLAATALVAACGGSAPASSPSGGPGAAGAAGPSSISRHRAAPRVRHHRLRERLLAHAANRIQGRSPSVRRNQSNGASGGRLCLPGIRRAARQPPPRRGARAGRHRLVHGAVGWQARPSGPADRRGAGGRSWPGLGATRRHRRPGRRRLGDRPGRQCDRSSRSGSAETRSFPMPDGRRAGPHTATFDDDGILWFTGQGGVIGRLDPDGRGGPVRRAARAWSLRHRRRPRWRRLVRLARRELPRPCRSRRRVRSKSSSLRRPTRAPAASGPTRPVGSG